MKVQFISYKSPSCFHDFPYNFKERKCPHYWIINLTPAGFWNCIHKCFYCYAREAIYAKDTTGTLQIYNNLPHLIEKDLKKMDLVPPVSISNVTDACQNIKELQNETKKIIAVLLKNNLSFIITTKANPEFLFALDNFIKFPHKAIALTIEGTDEVLKKVSPLAPNFKERINTLKTLSKNNIYTIVRLDPLFIHLFKAIYNNNWLAEIKNLIKIFKANGAKHIIVSTGKLSNKQGNIYTNSKINFLPSLKHLYQIIYKINKQESENFLNDYICYKNYGSNGFCLRRRLRSELHQELKKFTLDSGITYSSCQETLAKEDSQQVSCMGINLPFVKKTVEGFVALNNCNAKCFSCESLSCGEKKLTQNFVHKKSMYKISKQKSLF